MSAMLSFWQIEAPLTNSASKTKRNSQKSIFNRFGYFFKCSFFHVWFLENDIKKLKVHNPLKATLLIYAISATFLFPNHCTVLKSVGKSVKAKNFSLVIIGNCGAILKFFNGFKLSKNQAWTKVQKCHPNRMKNGCLAIYFRFGGHLELRRLEFLVPFYHRFLHVRWAMRPL